MPLVHRLSGTGFASSEDRSPRLRERPATIPATYELPQRQSDPTDPAPCDLCARRSSTFDLSRRCCLDRYESLFGSMNEHRSMFAHARACALAGDLGPARRLVESYRRVFGPLAAIELQRALRQSIAGVQSGVNPAQGRAAAFQR